MSTCKLRQADVPDAQAIYEVVNEAYRVEKGNTGLAFKKGDRYNSVEEVKSDIEYASSHPGEQRFFVLWAEEGATQRIVGCIRIYRAESGACDFGPFAVHPSAQGKGHGRAMMAAAEGIARELGCTSLEIEVVNHRTDLLPFYKRAGFEETSTAPCDKAHNCDETQLTRPSHFVRMRKSLAEE
mmetsp:Transcript_14469/g.41084  ORF Transcript_14469/g.41084 Transcript_14469/m.41084 type:complete len:183 (-) Transcript_14469:203-751(-)|eukprot:CAMPEP_0119152680 /NCGR_PEP_ID=MMETSP1310-20130426/48176_1 /TAXON_ID=464262 /ORGANISM="Genus nov. species nov., Strain RCC2339" /LENGTH=182 /DNA_ID=CAMNT_0007145069 /DNA_START=39 /DNA_END=587 /DNA_ORIENTATION=+